eukprot:767945-Hanusia_phi.AAC.22
MADLVPAGENRKSRPPSCQYLSHEGCGDWHDPHRLGCSRACVHLTTKLQITRMRPRAWRR